MSFRLPRPGRGEAWSLFLDFDGTLTDLAATPDSVLVSPGLRTTLAALFQALDGAMAVISGRPIAELDGFLGPLRLPAAGMHGLEWRLADGRVLRRRDGGQVLERLRGKLSELAEADRRLLIEDKGLAVALHYRGAPEREAELRARMEELVAGLDGYRVLCGKMVVEAMPAKTGKGQAIEAYMRQRPYRGRRPVFAGDDVTDEDGFAVVTRLGGITIKVGDGPTSASHRASTVSAFLAWLHDLPRSLRVDGAKDD